MNNKWPKMNLNCKIELHGSNRPHPGIISVIVKLSIVYSRKDAYWGTQQGFTGMNTLTPGPEKAFHTLRGVSAPILRTHNSSFWELFSGKPLEDAHIVKISRSGGSLLAWRHTWELLFLERVPHASGGIPAAK